MLVSACAPTKVADTPGAKKRVVCTTGMIADAARNIAGAHFDVTALMGPGVDPHLFKPSSADVRQLEQAHLILHNGLHLEGRMGDAIESMGRSTRVVAVSSAVPKDRLRTFGEEHEADPHIWFDVQLWSLTIDVIARELIALSPEHEAAIKANADKHRAELLELDREVRTRIATIPAERRVMVTAHDAFGYFSRAYSIEVLAIQGVSTDSEASLRDINRLVTLLTDRRIPAVFVETSVSQKTMQALVQGCAAKGHTIRIGGELFSDAMGDAGTPEGTYVGMVRHNVATIVTALNGASADQPGKDSPK